MIDTQPKIHIREAVSDDRDFILSLVPRFAEFEPPPWRPAKAILDKTSQSIKEGLAGTLNRFLIAESDGRRLGFIRLLASVDYFTGDTIGYVADVAVIEEAEGRGVGKALMAAAEQWATAQEFELLTLHVFAQNHRGLEFYKKLGYQPEVVKLVKPLK